MQQDGVESLQSDRVTEREIVPPYHRLRQKWFCGPKSFKNCTADSLIGSNVSKAIGWNTYDPDNAAESRPRPLVRTLTLLVLLTWHRWKLCVLA